MAVDVKYTGRATASAGRNGRTRSEDGLVDVLLSVPKAMGGPGKPGATTPEDLFAAGYAACFGGACEFRARELKLHPTSIEVTAAVGIGPNGTGGFGLVAALDVKLGGLSQADADRLVAAAHTLCPYSNAIKGNVPVTLNAHVA